MSKRIKPQSEIITTVEQAKVAMAEMAEIERSLAAIEADMNENIDIDTTFVPDDSASHSWTERDSELVEEYAAQLMAMSI